MDVSSSVSNSSPSFLSPRTNKRKWGLILGLSALVLLGGASGLIAWRLRQVEQVTPEEALASDVCALYGSAICGPLGSWQYICGDSLGECRKYECIVVTNDAGSDWCWSTSGQGCSASEYDDHCTGNGAGGCDPEASCDNKCCHVLNKGDEACGGWFYAWVFYCMGERPLCSDNHPPDTEYPGFYASGFKQRDCLGAGESHGICMVDPPPICTTVQVDAKGGGVEDAFVRTTPPGSGNWADCTTCEALSVDWDPSNSRVVMSGGSVGDPGGGPGAIDLDGQRSDFRFRVSGGGLNLSHIVSAAQAACVDRRVLGGDGHVVDPTNRDPYDDRGMACSTEHIFTGVSFQSGQTYTATLEVRDPQYGDSGWRTAAVCSETYTYEAPNPPICESLTATPDSLPYFGGTVGLLTEADPGDGGTLAYDWDSDGGTLSGYDDDTPETAVWTIPQNNTSQAVTHNAWVTVSNTLGSSGGQGTLCSVSIQVAPFPENDLTCDSLTASPESPGMGSDVSFTCVGTSQLVDGSGNPYPIIRIDFRVYFDSNGDNVFQETEVIREGSVAPIGTGPSWSAVFNPDPSLVVNQAGYYGAASRVCIDYEGTEQCTPFAVPQD